MVATSRLDEALAGADLLVIATSVAGLKPVMQAIAPSGQGAVTWLCKGLSADTGELPHAIVAGISPDWQAGCLSGPSFAQEVAAGLPVALTAAASDDALALRMVEAFHHGAMRVYRSGDLVGVEIAGVPGWRLVVAQLQMALEKGGPAQSAPWKGSPSTS